jgi:hypothetical protein
LRAHAGFVNLGRGDVFGTGATGCSLAGVAIAITTTSSRRSAS